MRFLPTTRENFKHYQHSLVVKHPPLNHFDSRRHFCHAQLGKVYLRPFLKRLFCGAKDMDEVGTEHRVIKNYHVGSGKSFHPRCVRRKADRGQPDLSAHCFTQELRRRRTLGANPVGFKIVRGEAEGFKRCCGAKVQNCGQFHIREKCGEWLVQWPGVAFVFSRSRGLILGEINTLHAGSIKTRRAAGREEVIPRP
jgi:hypothetical protein